MKKIILLVGVICWALTFSKAEGIEFFDGTFEEAMEAAKMQNKLIFVDAYAIWCGPCKAMAANVFPKPEVGAVFNENFINMKIDMERGIGLEFRKKYPVSAFPTLFFMDDEGEILERVVGAKSVPDLINLGLKHAANRVPGKNLAQEYVSGNREPELIYDYIKALNEAGKPSLSVTNDFLSTREDTDNPEVLKVIFEGATDSDSKVFELLIANRKQIEQLFSTEEIDEKIYKACLKTAYKAADYDYYELKEEAKTQVKKHLPQKHKDFSLQADLVFTAFTFDESSFLSIAKQYMKTVGKDPDKAYEAALIAEMNFPKSAKVMTETLSWLEEAAKNGEASKYWLQHALVFEKMGKYQEALQSAQKAKAQAEKAGDPLFRIEQLIINLESQ